MEPLIPELFVASEGNAHILGDVLLDDPSPAAQDLVERFSLAKASGLTPAIVQELAADLLKLPLAQRVKVKALWEKL